MIVGVPDRDELHNTAVGWLNLAREITIKEVEDFQECDILFDELEKTHGLEKAEEVVQKHWQSAQYRLHNALSLLQQALEISLKARIAEVSPFLLIAGDPQSWPRPDATGSVDCSNFRTLDAVQLCRAARIVSASPLPDSFVEFFDRLRKTRNKISHLNAGSVQAEAISILIDILAAHKHLFPDDPWVVFRKEYLISAERYLSVFDGEDFAHDTMMAKVATALAELEPKHAELFFQFNPKQRGFRCPRCLELRTSWSDREWPLAQVQENGMIKCIGCLSVYTKQQYKDRIKAFFEYLDEAERRQIDEKLDEDFP